MTNAVRILGIDPGLRRTGWGVVACEGSRLVFVGCGTIAPSDALPMAERLNALLEGLAEVIGLHAPDEAAVEEVFVNANGQSTLKLGQARACALLAPARAGLPVAEYATTLVKKAVTGAGRAEKDQVGFMVRRLLPAVAALHADPGADACDALATAIAHAHLRGAALRAVAAQMRGAA